MKQYCPAFIYVRVTRDGMKLELSQLDETHNHETSAIAVCQFSKLMVLGTSNESRSNQTDGQRNKSEEYKLLRKQRKTSKSCITYSKVELLTDNEDNFLGMFIQDSRMKEEFLAFQMVCADAMYKLVDIRIPWYVSLIEQCKLSERNCSSWRNILQ
ncbi:hypothetical protein QTP88_003406 [Uroleucon formosanum]